MVSGDAAGAAEAMELGGGSPWCLCLQTMLILFLCLGGKPAVGFNPYLNVSFSESGSLLV